MRVLPQASVAIRIPTSVRKRTACSRAPTMPVTAFPHPGNAAGPTSVNGVPVERPAIDFHRFTGSPSHAGLPAISLPCGFSSEGLPVGLQIIGPLYADAAVLVAAAVIEKILPWSDRRPPI